MKIKVKQMIEQDVEIEIEFPLYIKMDISLDSGEGSETWSKIEAPNQYDVFLAVEITRETGHKEEWDIGSTSYGVSSISNILSENRGNNYYSRITETEWMKAVEAFYTYVAETLRSSLSSQETSS